MNNLNTTVNSLEWRRSKVLELSSQGRSQPEIARALQISQSTVNRDISYLRSQARRNLQRHIEDRLPEEYQKCMAGLNQVLRMGWDIVQSDYSSTANRLQALALITDSYRYLLDLTTNGVVITDAIKYVQSKMAHLDIAENNRYNMSTERNNKHENEDIK